MVKIFIYILNRFINNEQFVQKLADSYPIRRAAQLVVYFYHRNKATALEYKNLGQLQGLKLKDKLKKIYEELENQKRKLN